MSNRRRNRRTAKSPRQGAMGRAKAKMKLAANVTEEQDWYLDTPDVRLTRIFTVVLLLHAIAVGGIVAFKMVDKASATTSIAISSARENYESAVKQQKELAAQVPGSGAAEQMARPKPAAPLRLDPAKGNQYKIQTGDTLSEVAKSLNVPLEALRRVNSITSDNELYPGRVLDIPTKEQVVAKPAQPQAAAVETPKAPAKPGHYVVKQGDTVWGIARQFNVSYNELLKINGIDKPEKMQIGQRLQIPGR